MGDRRDKERSNPSDRRTFPRPPLWLNLALIALAIAVILFGRQQRISINQRYSELFSRTADAPSEINKIRSELASLDVDEQKLESELEGRMMVVESLKSKDFYISIDTSKKKFLFYYGNDVVREVDMQIGEPKTLTSGKKTWTFVPFKGATSVSDKRVGMAWKVPAWVYLMNNQPVPGETPTVENGLGKYVILLPNDYVIHSPPSADSPLEGPKPGSFMIPEGDMQAIWPRINSNTRVFIF